MDPTENGFVRHALHVAKNNNAKCRNWMTIFWPKYELC
jgi:hypothetical protein